MLARTLFGFFCVVVVIHCGGQASDAQVLDYRVALPQADPMYVDLVPPEVVVPAGTETMYCYSITYEGEDLAVSNLEVKQGPFGHHLALLKAAQPQINGTLEDCTDESSMGGLRTFVLPGIELPAGNAIKISKGEQFVLQFHYVNAGREDIRVRDLARLKRVEEISIHTWVNTFTTNTAYLQIDGQSDGQVEFECVLAQDINLLVLGGHMHELGTSFDLQYGSNNDNLTSIYNVDPWLSGFRDAPPVVAMLSVPLLLEAGNVLRTSCTWFNATDMKIEFPAEMCSAFGYLSGAQTPFHCEAVQ